MFLSCNVMLAVKKKNICKRIAHIFSVHDTVNKTVLIKKFSRLKALRQFVINGLLYHARACKPDQGFWLGDRDVSCMAKLAVTPPVVGWVNTLTCSSLCLLWRANAMVVRDI